MLSRERLIELAESGFSDWVRDLTDGEIGDMLRGNSSAYSGMPDLSRWIEQEELNEVCDYKGGPEQP